jgi:hypothetical protein
MKQYIKCLEEARVLKVGDTFSNGDSAADRLE